MIGIVIFLFAAAAFFFLVGERAQIAVQDNLDLFQAQYQMMKNTGSFFGTETQAPFLHGISRDVLPSALQLPGLLYVFFSSYIAYVLSYLLKIMIGTLSMVLLAETLFGEETVVRYKNAVLFTAFAYGLISFFPAFGIAFASIPLAVHVFIRLYRAKEKKTCALYLSGVFLLFLFRNLSGRLCLVCLPVPDDQGQTFPREAPARERFTLCGIRLL